jgi:hypothetical protein
MNIKTRLQALEHRLISGDVTLRMPDGSIERLSGRIGGVEDFRLHLVETVSCGNPTIEQKCQLDLIASSQSSEEPDGAHLIELIRCALRGPVREEQAPLESV